jgi:hypothetical protein
VARPAPKEILSLIPEPSPYIKEKMMEAARAEDWDQCLLLLPTPYRSWAFQMVIQHEVNDADYWRMLGELWIHSEGSSRARTRYLKLFSSPRGERDHLMNAGELAHYRALPPTVELYRGAIPRYARGMSWTQDLEEAAWFAWRHAVLGTRGHLYRATVDRVAVLACFDQRGESEAVIDPRLLPPLRAIRWTPEELGQMAERAKRRKEASDSKILESLKGPTEPEDAATADDDFAKDRDFFVD